MHQDPRFEVIPLPGIAEALEEHLPAQSTVTITASPRKGLGPTVDLAAELAGGGVHAVPHLAARLISGEAELDRILGRLVDAGVREIFVIAGDAEQPAGDFAGALELLEAMERLGYDFTVGVAGYPEPHPKIADHASQQALWDKQFHASYIVSQMCFEAQTLADWVQAVRQRGIRLPIRVGVAGPATTGQLLRISAKIGVGQSIRVLSHHRTGLWRLARPGTWTPDALLDELAPTFEDRTLDVRGLHVYTFNAVAETARWWRDVTHA